MSFLTGTPAHVVARETALGTWREHWLALARDARAAAADCEAAGASRAAADFERAASDYETRAEMAAP